MAVLCAKWHEEELAPGGVAEPSLERKVLSFYLWKFSMLIIQIQINYTTTRRSLFSVDNDGIILLMAVQATGLNVIAVR